MGRYVSWGCRIVPDLGVRALNVLVLIDLCHQAVRQPAALAVTAKGPLGDRPRVLGLPPPHNRLISSPRDTSLRNGGPKSRRSVMGMKRGTRMGAMEKSPRRRKIERNRRMKQDFQWAAKAGPVTTVQLERGPDGAWIRPTE
jgi:hypothetical protein